MDAPRGYHTKLSKPKTNIIWYHFYVESEKKRYREFPGGLMVRTQHFHCHGLGSIPGLGPEIFQALWHGEKKRYKWSYLQNRNRLTDIENKLMVTKEERGEGIN